MDYTIEQLEDPTCKSAELVKAISRYRPNLFPTVTEPSRSEAKGMVRAALRNPNWDIATLDGVLRDLGSRLDTPMMRWVVEVVGKHPSWGLWLIEHGSLVGLTNFLRKFNKGYFSVLVWSRMLWARQGLSPLGPVRGPRFMGHVAGSDCDFSRGYSTEKKIKKMWLSVSRDGGESMLPTLAFDTAEYIVVVDSRLDKVLLPSLVVPKTGLHLYIRRMTPMVGYSVDTPLTKVLESLDPRNPLKGYDGSHPGHFRTAPPREDHVRLLP